MKTMVCRSEIYVLGHLWMPGVLAGATLVPYDSDIENMKDDDGNVTRESVDDWISTHAGDFQDVVDWGASLEVVGETVEIGWESEENELQWWDCLYGTDEG